jgi:hypothetical protein
MMTKTTADLFAVPVTKRARRKARDAWAAAVKNWAKDQVYWLKDVYADPDNEWDMCMIDGSGPPSDWRDKVVTRMRSDLIDAGLVHEGIDEWSDSELVKAAIRLGKLPRSIIASVPPKPPELL